MHAVVAAGGELPASGRDTRRALFLSAEFVIAADSGLHACADADIWPHVVVGDFDSADPDLVAQATERGVEILRYPTDKDATDLELGMELAVERGAEEITVISPFGARVDHELANIALLASDRWSGHKVSAHDGLRSLWVVRDSLTLVEAVDATVTLLPWGGDAAGVITSGLRWPLNDETLELGSTRGVSNVAGDSSQRVAIESGVLLVVVDQRA